MRMVRKWFWGSQRMSMPQIRATRNAICGPVLAVIPRTPTVRSTTMLSQSQVIAYIPVSDVARARKFYEAKLGFKAIESSDVGALYESGKGSRFFAYKSAGAGTNKASTAYWDVADLDAEMADLRKRGVVFEEYDNPGYKTVNGVATGDGVKTAWFKDPDGNILALAQRL
jgi:catechol 2,3-dioxygenase-like lactoylglutathione lyase family enzyme